MTTIGTVLVSLISSSAVAGLVAFFGQRRHEVWVFKRDACLEALEIVNGIFANGSWDAPANSPLLPQEKPTIASMRRCHNRLAVVCRNPDVVKSYLECLGLGEQLSMERLDDLRDAVRKECGLAWKKLRRDKDRSFLWHIQESVEAQDGLTP